MKKSVFTGLFIFLVCGLILSACFSPWKGGDEVEIVINFTGGSGSGRSVTLDQLKYIVTLSGNNETITIEENGGGAIRATVSVGHWNVKIDAYLNEELYATGSNSVDVKAGQNNYVTIKIIPVTVQNDIDAQTPVITSQPQSAVYTVNATATELSVTAEVTDGGILSYQWYSNDTNDNTSGELIEGADDDNYIPPTDTEKTVYYYVIVTNTNEEAAGNKTAEVTSETAEIIVDTHVHALPPVISEHPHGDVEYTINAVAAALTVTAEVEDGGTLSYQWYSHNMSSNSGGTPINGALSASYTPPTNTAGTVYYYVEVTNTIADNEDGGNKTATTNSHTAKIITHEFSTTWTYNATQHWRECTVEGCEAKIEIANHYEYEWTITIGATAVNNGVETSMQACVCGETTGTPRVSTAGLSYTLISGKQEYEVAAGTETSGAVIIASKYEGLPVTAIAEAVGTTPNLTGSFFQTAITSVIIPDGVETIGNYAFRGCQSLTSITIPDSVTTISRGAFSLCPSLTSITIPDNVTTISESAFVSCTSLTSVEIGNSVQIIDIRAFYNCTSLTSVIIPDSVTSIGNNVFQNCTSLTSVIIPNSVISIGNYAFQSCTGLTSVTIGSGVTSIGNYAFFGCSGLTGIIIPNSVTTIGAGAFSECTNLTSVSIGTGITSIGENAFNNQNLASVTIYAITPPTNDCYAAAVFNLQSRDSSFRIKVPAGSVDVYKSVWGTGFYDNLYEAITP